MRRNTSTPPQLAVSDKISAMTTTKPNHYTLCILSLLILSLTACGGGNSKVDDTQNTDPTSYSPELELDIFSPNISSQNSLHALTTWQQVEPESGPLNLYANTQHNGQWGNETPITSTTDQDAMLVSSAINASGQAIAAWVQWDEGNRLYNVWANTYTPTTGWGSALEIDEYNQGDSLYPQVAINNNGVAIIVWSNTNTITNESRVMAQTFTFADSSWSGTNELGLGDIHISLPRIALNDNDVAIVAWSQLVSGWLSVYSNIFNGTWQSTPMALETDNSGDASAPQLALNASNQAHVIWHQSDGTNQHVWSNYYSGAEWGGPQLLDETSDIDSRHPRIAIDEQGNAFALWLEIHESKQSIWASTYGTANNWSTPKLIEENDDTNAYSPRIAINANGDPLAIWSQQALETNDAKIWTNRYDKSSEKWQSAQIYCHANNTHISNPQLTSTNDNYLVLAWEFAADEPYECEDNVVTVTEEDSDNTSEEEEAPPPLSRIQIEWLTPDFDSQ